MTVTSSGINDNTINLAQWDTPKYVKLQKANKSLGFSIVAGKVFVQDKQSPNQVEECGIFIKTIVQDSPAGRCESLRIGDRILEVNGINLTSLSYDQVVQMIRETTDIIELLVQSIKTDDPPKKQSNEASVASNTTNYRSSFRQSKKQQAPDKPKPKPEPELKKAFSESGESSEEEETVTLEGNVTTKFGMEISRRSAGNVKRSQAEIDADPETEDEFGYTAQKIAKKYGQLEGEVLLVEIQRSSRLMGIYLAGHADRKKMGVFVCGLNSSGAAAKHNNLQLGDQVLEINGIVLQGRCHLNTSSIIRKVSTIIVKIIIRRHTTCRENIAVDSVVHMSRASLGTNFLEQYPNARELIIQKSYHGLGIMIVEGNHAKVGRGIFVSDIQEGSSAEQAGLQVGDLILQVNSDSLLETNYNEATNFLKNADGIVTLVVCNPNLIKETQAGSDDKTAATDNKTPGTGVTEVNSAATAGADGKKAEEKKAEPVSTTKKMKGEIQLKNGTNINFSICGGSDTSCKGIFIADVHGEIKIEENECLKRGDQILDMGSESYQKIEYNAALYSMAMAPEKVTLNIMRNEQFSKVIDVEIQNRPNKDLNFSIQEFKSGKGVYICEKIPDESIPELKNIEIGDHFIEISGIGVKEGSIEEIIFLLKLDTSVKVKLQRFQL